jgi:hypothetical protein
MMSSIRAQTEALEIWHLSFADFASILLSSMEATNVAFNQSLIEQTLASGVEQFLLLNSKKSWLMRANLDSAQLVLNEGRKRCSDHSDFKVGNPSAFVQSLELARQTTEVMLAWDHYSFGRVEVSIRKNEIRVNRPDTLTSLRSGNYRERMMQLDITDRSSTHQRFSMLSEKLKADISAEQFSLPFDEFIASPTGRRTLEELRPLTETHEKELSNRLDLLIDLDSQVKLGRLRHVYRDLVTIWCYLTRIAMIARVWGELVLASTGEYPVPILTLNRLREAFVGLRELEESSINKGIRHFSSSIDQKPIVDLFHQPLLRLSDAVVLIPPSYILSSRFDRNLISVVAREKNDSVAVKGKKPLRRLKTLFENAGFRCLEDVNIRNDSGKPLTDLDLLACRDNDVFFFQSKVLSIPDTPYEYWRVYQTLLSAALQMDLVVDHKSQVEMAYQKANPEFTLKGKKVSAYLVTDVMVHSGFKLKGYEVVDFDFLQHVLSGARLGVFDVLRQEVIGTFNEIEGDSPSSEEIRRLISALRAQKSRPLKGNSEQRIELGGWALIAEGTSFV